MGAIAPLVISAVVGTAVAKVGGALVGQMTGNEQLGNIIGAIGGAYAGGMAAGGFSTATAGVNATTGSGAVETFSAFDVADAGNLAGSLGGGASTTMNGGAALQEIFGGGGQSSADFLAGVPDPSKVVTNAPSTAVGGGVGGGMNTASSAGGAAASAGKGLMGSFSDFIQTPGGMQMAGSTIQGIAGGLSKQSEIDAQKDLINQKYARDDSLSRVVSVEPIRLKQRDSEGVYSTSKYGVA